MAAKKKVSKKKAAKKKALVARAKSTAAHAKAAPKKRKKAVAKAKGLTRSTDKWAKYTGDDSAKYLSKVERTARAANAGAGNRDNAERTLHKVTSSALKKKRLAEARAKARKAKAKTKKKVKAYKRKATSGPARKKGVKGGRS